MFNNEEQDPRLYGASSFGDSKKTVIKKGVFTSLRLNDGCPPWSIKSKKIIHDKINRNLIYEKAILNIYDIPVMYFPKFSPDPTVEGEQGLFNHNLIDQKY